MGSVNNNSSLLVQDSTVPRDGGHVLPEPPIPSTPTVNIISANCRGLNDDVDRSNFFHFLKSLNPHIFVLQETKLRNSSTLSFGWKGDCLSESASESASGGVACLSLHPIKFDFLHSQDNGIILTFLVNDTNFLLVNVYAPNDNNSRKEFFSLVHSLISQFMNDDVHAIILLGDFNYTSSLLDNIHNNASNQPSSLDALIEDFDLVDAYRSLNPQGSDITWSNTVHGTRIDRLLISRGFIHLVKNFQHVPNPFSDHKLLSFSLNFNDVNVSSPNSAVKMTIIHPISH